MVFGLALSVGQVVGQSPAPRLLSAPYTEEAAYELRYATATGSFTTNVALVPGMNQIAVAVNAPDGTVATARFDITRVATLADRTQIDYDRLDNPARILDAFGRETRFTYDGLGRLLEVTPPPTESGARFERDGNDNLVRLEDGIGTTHYVYDELDRLRELVLPGPLGTLRYEHDAAGRVASLTYPNGLRVEYGYDAAGRLETVSQGTDLTRYQYDAGGLLHAVAFPNGVRATYVYDAQARLTDLEYVDRAGLLLTGFHYAMDANGNRTRIEVRQRARGEAGQAEPIVTRVYGYRYDARDRLTEVVNPDGSTLGYTYDANGNRLTETTDSDGPAGPAAPAVSYYYYGIENRLERITDAAGQRLKEFFYDPRGNQVMLVTPHRTVRFEYDYRNLLTRVADGTQDVRFEYDGNGERIAKIVNGRATRYVNDPTRNVTQVLLELDDAGTVTRSYVYGLDRLSHQSPGQSSPVYYLTDALASTVGLLDRSGIPLADFEYTAFGALAPGTMPRAPPLAATEFLFNGERRDLETDLIYLRARYYDPTTGRFLAKDPGGFDDGPNAYLYVGNNPVNEIDPLGLARVSSGVVFKVGFDLKRDPFLGIRNLDFSAGIQKTLWPEISAWTPKASLSFMLPVTTTPVGLLTAGLKYDFGGQGLGASLGLKTGLGTFSATFYRHQLELQYKYTPELPFLGGLKRQDPLSLSATLSLSYRDIGAFATRTALGATHALGTGFGALGQGLSTLGQNMRDWASSFDRGGVLLDRAVGFVGDLSSIAGAAVDPATGQVVLVGRAGTGGTVPELRLDDFVIALRAVYGSAEDPGVTIDPPKDQEANPSVQQRVQLFGGLEDTDLGWVLLEADRVMKTLAVERDNVTGQPVHTAVPGYRSILQRWTDRAAGAGGDIRRASRLWFVPSDVQLVRSAGGKSFVFDRTAVQLLTEDMLVGQGAVDPDAQAFADWVTANYAALSQEQFTVYDYPSDGVGLERPSAERIFQRLEQVARAIAFARFLYDNRIPVDFGWIEHYPPRLRNTPQYVRTVVNSRTVTVPGGQLTILISGGVTLETPNTYLPDDGTAALLEQRTLAARPGELAMQWEVDLGNGAAAAALAGTAPPTAAPSLRAVALSLNPMYLNGGAARVDPDLSYVTPGEVPLSLARFYRSGTPVAGSFGYGWEYLPYALGFTRPAITNSPRSSFGLLNGLREGEVVIEDRAGGRLLSFVSSLTTARQDGLFVYGGLNPSGVPTFAAGGSEQPDGSTLTQIPESLGFVLLRPGGLRVEFDAAGRLERITDSRGRTVRYTDSSPTATTIEDSLGRQLTLVRDPQGRVVRALGLYGDVMEYTYDASGHLTAASRIRQGLTLTWRYEYDAEHRLTRVHRPDRVMDGEAVSDLLGRVSQRRDARGNQFRQEYDVAQGRTRSIDDADGSSTVRESDDRGRPVLITDALGRETRYAYLGVNRQPSLVELPDPQRAPIRLKYDLRGNLVETADPVRGGDADGDGRDDHPIASRYDSGNRLIEYRDARGLLTRFTYNEHGQLLTLTRAAGTPREATTTWTYEARGFLLSQTDPAGVVTRFAHDDLGNLTNQIVAPGTPAQVSTSYTYDEFGRRTSEADAAGRRTRYAYDGRDQITRTILEGPEPLTSYRTFDPDTGRLKTETDFRGYPAEYDYDAATGDLVTLVENGAVLRLGYDRLGQLDRIEDPVGNVTAFAYDTARRQTEIRSLPANPRPRFSSPPRIQGGLELSVEAPTGARLRLERTANLLDPQWTEATEVTTTETAPGRFVLTATLPPATQQFYRVRVLP